MMSLIKICGLSTPETLEAALDAGADMVGFVFFPPSPRNVTAEAVAPLGRQVRRRAQKVALTVDADDEALDLVCLALRPDMLQLHGRETPERVAAIRARLGLPVLKAVGIAEAADLDRLAAYHGAADWLLLDAKPPRGSVLPGGNGVAFDWTLLAALDRGLPVMLSGGLDAASVGEAIRLVRPDAVDVSSGVERAPGEKDPVKIGAFVAAARAAFAATKPDERQRA
jgi:phosphoribosylanthranilate isomerase